jgi:hypothetical protein
MKQTIHCSKEMAAIIGDNLNGVPVKESNLFPFRFSDGDICHGVSIPEFELGMDMENGRPRLYFSDLEKPEERFKNYWLHTMKAI